MALFPVSPAIGDQATIAGNTFQWDGIKWNKISITTTSGGSASIESSDNVPANPVAGDVWFNTTNLELYVYYNDGTDSQWVQVTSDSVIIDDLAQDLIPAQDVQYNIGAPDTKWSSGYFRQLFVGEREISGVATSAAAGVINTSNDLPDTAPIGQMYVITQEQAVKVWLGSSWVNLIDGAIPTITAVEPRDGELWNGETDKIFRIIGTNFITNDAGSPSVKVRLQDGTELVANYISVISTEEIQFSFFRTFTVAEGPLDVIVSNPNGLAATKVNAIQTGNAPQWIGPQQVFTTTTGTQVNTSIRTNIYISDDNAITSFTFKVYEDITYAVEKTDRLITAGLTLNEDGSITGTAPTVTSDSTYNMFVGIIDGVGNETKVNLTFKVISSFALPTANAAFAASNRPGTISQLGSTFTDFTVVDAPFRNSTMLSHTQYYNGLGYTTGGQAIASLLRNGTGGWFDEGKVLKLFATDPVVGTNQAAFAFEDATTPVDYTQTGWAAGNTAPASSYANARSVCMWGYNGTDGWQALWHFPVDNTIDLTSNLRLLDGGTTAHVGFVNSGNRGYRQRRKVTSTTAPQNLTYNQERSTSTSLFGKQGYAGTKLWNRYLNPSSINVDYITGAEYEVVAACGDLSASDEYVYLYAYPAGSSANMQTHVLSTGLDSANPLNYSHTFSFSQSDLQEISGIGSKGFYVHWEATSRVDTEPTSSVSSNSFSSLTPLNGRTWGVFHRIKWYYTIPGSSSTSYVYEYATTYGFGKQAAFDTMPLENIGFSVYT